MCNKRSNQWFNKPAYANLVFIALSSDANLVFIALSSDANLVFIALSSDANLVFIALSSDEGLGVCTAGKLARALSLVVAYTKYRCG